MSFIGTKVNIFNNIKYNVFFYNEEKEEEIIMSRPIITTDGNPVSRSQAIANLIESIALEGTGLSHIINAEGEKVQAAIAMLVGTSNTQALVDVNSSVQETLKIISKIEMLLEYKLEIARTL